LYIKLKKLNKYIESYDLFGKQYVDFFNHGYINSGRTVRQAGEAADSRTMLPLCSCRCAAVDVAAIH
jgi:hypothetical protein